MNTDGNAGNQWIEVVEWERYQHRDAARSKVLPWIKTETSLLSSPDYLELSAHCRAVLHGVWLEYARSLRRLPNNTETLTRQLGIKVFRSHLEALNHAGFITFSASRPARTLAGTLAGGDLDGEREGFNKPLKSAHARNGTGDAKRIEALIRNGAISEPVDVDLELAASTTLSDEQRAFLRSLIGAEPE